jgi:hypothetical protein
VSAPNYSHSLQRFIFILIFSEKGFLKHKFSEEKTASVQSGGVFWRGFLAFFLFGFSGGIDVERKRRCERGEDLIAL